MAVRSPPPSRVHSGCAFSHEPPCFGWSRCGLASCRFQTLRGSGTAMLLSVALRRATIGILFRAAVAVEAGSG
jgi:hypothetical protein